MFTVVSEERFAYIFRLEWRQYVHPKRRWNQATWCHLLEHYFSQNYWVFGLFPSSGILENRKDDVSETGSVSLLRWRGEKTPSQLGPLEKANLNHWLSSGRWTKSKNPVILCVIHHRQNTLESANIILGCQPMRISHLTNLFITRSQRNLHFSVSDRFSFNRGTYR
jgi:hypothetical protein